MSTLWLLRHPPVVAEAGLCYGRTDLACAVEATDAVADAVASLLPAGTDVHTSPLRRCATLAAEIGVRRPDLRTAARDPRLAEMDFGAWEGRAWSDIDHRELDAWTDDFADFHVGGNGESARMFMRRVGAAWDDWRTSGRDALWVTHAGVMRAVILLRDGVACPVSAAEWPRRSIGYGEWLRVET